VALLTGRAIAGQAMRQIYRNPIGEIGLVLTLVVLGVAVGRGQWTVAHSGVAECNEAGSPGDARGSQTEMPANLAIDADTIVHRPEGLAGASSPARVMSAHNA
jgi:hypothetical protein